MFFKGQKYFFPPVENIVFFHFDFSNCFFCVQKAFPSQRLDKYLFAFSYCFLIYFLIFMKLIFGIEY